MTRQICPPDHPHGASTQCYIKHRCGCEDCRARHATTEAKRRKDIAYGRYDRALVDAAPVRDHIAWLRSQGLGAHQMQAASGVPSRTISGIMWGRPNAAGEIILPAKVRPDTARRILAIQPTLETLAPHGLVDGRGTLRRLQALATLGWSSAELARRLGSTETTLQRTGLYRQVTAAKARAIRALYDTLWDQQPPARTATQRAMAKRTQARARALGWASPLAWDDIDNDDTPATALAAKADGDDVDVIAIELAVQGARVHLNTEERRLAVQQLHARHHSDQEIATLLDCSDKTISRDREHLQLPAALGPDRRPIAA